MLKKLFTILLFVLSANAFAQVKTVSGMVTGNNLRISGANIHNLQNDARTTSDIRGMFTIKANSGDTLVVNFINYTPQLLVVNNDNNIIISLSSSSKMLKQVNVRDTLNDPLKKFNKNKKEYAEIYVRGDKSHIFSFPTSIGMYPEIGIALNIDKLYNALSKQGKDARRLQRDFVRDYHDDIIDKRFTRKLVQNITGYTGDRLDDFMVSYRPTYDFMTKASDYDIELYIKKNYTDCQKKLFNNTNTALSASR